MYEYTKIFDLSYIDPVGAIIISFYIVYNWWKVGSGESQLYHFEVFLKLGQLPLCSFHDVVLYRFSFLIFMMNSDHFSSLNIIDIQLHI